MFESTQSLFLRKSCCTPPCACFEASVVLLWMDESQKSPTGQRVFTGDGDVQMFFF